MTEKWTNNVNERIKLCDCFEFVVVHLRQKNTLQYFFGYKTEFFSFQNNPKDLDPSSS